MKNVFLMLAVLVSSAAAQAAPMFCQTAMHPAPVGMLRVNVSDNMGVRMPYTVSVEQVLGQYVRPLGQFTVTVSHMGPEMGVYANPAAQFQLMISAIRMGDRRIHGNLVMELNGARINEPVTCVIALN